MTTSHHGSPLPDGLRIAADDEAGWTYHGAWVTDAPALPTAPAVPNMIASDGFTEPLLSDASRQAPDPKRIAYSREDRDYWAYYDDEFIGAYPNHLAAERALNDHALYLAEQGLTVFARPAELVEPVYVAPLLLTCASCGKSKPLTAFVNIDQEVVCDACLAEDARAGGGAESLPETIALALTGTADPRCGCGAPAFVSHDSHLYCQALWQQGACVPPFTDVCLSCGDPCLDSTCAACHEAGEDLSPPAEPAKKLIPLTHGQHTIVDAEDYDFLMQWKWQYQPIRSRGRVVRRATQKGRRRTIFMHRLILGVCGTSVQVDHRDRNPLNNTRANLRICDYIQNGYNRTSQGGKSQYKGVRWHPTSRKWQATITVNRRRFYLGGFTNESAAAKAYDDAARIHHGEFACFNLPESERLMSTPTAPSDESPDIIATTAALLSTDQCKVGEALAWEFSADPVGFLAQLEGFTDRARHAVATAMAAYTEKTVGDVIEFWGESRERAVALGMLS